jgi:hypothetical protein
MPPGRARIGGPPVPMMHRSPRPRSSGPSALRNSSARGGSLLRGSRRDRRQFSIRGIGNQRRPVGQARSAWSSSSSVRNSLPAYVAGRSSGVPEATFQTPCRSGSPHGVRGVRAVTAVAGGATCPAKPMLNAVTSTVAAASRADRMNVSLREHELMRFKRPYARSRRDATGKTGTPDGASRGLS